MHLAERGVVRGCLVGRRGDELEREPYVAGKPRAAAPHDLTGDGIQRLRSGTGHRIRNECRACRVASQLRAIDSPEIIEIRMNEPIGLVSETNRRYAGIEKRIVIRVPLEPYGLRVVALLASVMGEVRTRV